MRNNLLKYMSLAVLFFSFSSVQAAGPVLDHVPGTTKVNAEKVLDLAESLPDLVIVDARIPQDRQAAGWIPGAVFLPNIETDEASLANVIPTKSTPVVFYCNGPKCGRSGDSATKAVKAGYKNIYYFQGGWEEWASAGLPAER
ncbi:rhodanese-like domain-containing protein [Thiomicrospira microaerophila]|uniref:rhodanese-like domain-containing protein n=1 Tax=Thiomicrospira microaerophila TaxID=406020 RepID=UPI0006976510|nr:rhodanese-like domain-containing protein [Thiomicrospira microaerophila]